MPDIRNVSDVNTARMYEDITDVTDKGEYAADMVILATGVRPE